MKIVVVKEDINLSSKKPIIQRNCQIIIKIIIAMYLIKNGFNKFENLLMIIFIFLDLFIFLINKINFFINLNFIKKYI